MGGLRIHHPTESNVVLLVPVPAKTPELGGVPKDIRIHLDEEGNSIVSEGVWNELLRAKASGLSSHEFVILNEVSDPPTIMAMSRNQNAPTKRTWREQMPGTLYETELQAIAQQFAPKGVKAQLTTKKKEDGR
jgi:hypothetical protein